MKIVILFFIVISVLFLFRFLKNKTIDFNKQHKNTDEKIIDLEKDSKTNEYKPKE